MTCEFDQFRRGNEIFAERLRRHGKLLELYIQPGTGHALYTAEAREQFWKDEARVFAAYL